MHSRKTSKHPGTRGHEAADALDWNEAMNLVETLENDEYYRDALLVASGCFLGLRISDLLSLRWKDLTGEDKEINLVEKKTGKRRSLRLNPALSGLASRCYDKMHVRNPNGYIFTGQYYRLERPITRRRALQILSEAKSRYGIKSAKVFSTHSLRKTFGRRVWLRECERGRGEQALLLLQEVFGHSSVQITRRYLGIRREEVLSVYDSLN